MPSAIEESVRRADAMSAEPSQPSPDLSMAAPVSSPVSEHAAPQEAAIPTPSADLPEAPTEEQPPAVVAAQQDPPEPEPVATSAAVDEGDASGLGAQSGSLANRPLLELLHTLLK